MLQKLTIKNFAIIENSSLEFHQGFNVLIGETGAGKSIILDALKFVLGAKAQKEYIRNGEQELLVKATFIDLQKTTIKKLKMLDVECDDVLLISRSYNLEGKSICKINGEIISISMLKQIGESLYDIYGQHENVELLNTKNHLKLLDSFGAEILKEDKEQIKILLNTLNDLNQQISEIGGTAEDRERTLDLLKYQIEEIENSNLFIGEDDKLDDQINTLSNSEKITYAISSSLENISSNRIGGAISALAPVSNFNSAISQVNERLQSVEIELEDIQSVLKDLLSTMEFSQQELDNLVSRQEIIKSLKRKYGSTIEKILSYLSETQKKYDNILNSEKVLSKLNKEKEDILSQLFKTSLSLHNKRKDMAKVLEQRVIRELDDLKMKNTTFKVHFDSIKMAANNEYTLDGLDKVEFLFSANQGEIEKSLTKTISGGELSRFMLAIKTVLGSKDDVKTLVFDEIDSGVSGEIGYKVGEKLYALSLSSQIICITHLPQVTALADNHIFVYKKVIDGKTFSEIKVLSNDDLIKYLSTLLGGYNSETSKLHAEELLNLAKNKKLDLNK